MTIEELLMLNGLSMKTIEESDTAIYCLNRQRQIICWNPMAEKLTGYSAKTMVGQSCFRSGLKHKDEQGRSMCVSMCPVMATILDGEPRSQRVSALCSDGKRRWMQVRTKALLQNGDIGGAVEFFSLADESEA